MTYQHVIWDTRPEVIVELGSYRGGSAVWFADQLRALCGRGQVITVDTVPLLGMSDPMVTVLTGDLRTMADTVRQLVGGRRTMVVEDSAHTYDVTLAALLSYAPLIQRGCYFVVEDTIVDTDLSIWPPGGVTRAIDEFLRRFPRFVRRDLAYYGITMHMGGWLEAA
jgi:cephalosporin hydroxylase